MKILLLTIIVLTCAAFSMSVELGPTARVLFPLSATSGDITTDSVFCLKTTPQIGAEINLSFTNRFSVESSVLYGTYSPDLPRPVPASSDSTWSENTSGSITSVSMTVSYEWENIYVSAGAELHHLKESWTEVHESSEVSGTPFGYEKQDTENRFGPVIGVGFIAPMGLSELVVDLTCHAPRFDDLLVSAGVSLLFK